MARKVTNTKSRKSHLHKKLRTTKKKKLGGMISTDSIAGLEKQIKILNEELHTEDKIELTDAIDYLGTQKERRLVMMSVFNLENDNQVKEFFDEIEESAKHGKISDELFRKGIHSLTKAKQLKRSIERYNFAREQYDEQKIIVKNLVSTIKDLDLELQRIKNSSNLQEIPSIKKTLAPRKLQPL
jgi:hypothetical protein